MIEHKYLILDSLDMESTELSDCQFLSYMITRPNLTWFVDCTSEKLMVTDFVSMLSKILYKRKSVGMYSDVRPNATNRIKTIVLY